MTPAAHCADTCHRQKLQIIEEVRLLRALKHPALMKFYASWYRDGVVVFITEVNNHMHVMPLLPPAASHESMHIPALPWWKSSRVRDTCTQHVVAAVKLTHHIVPQVCEQVPDPHVPGEDLHEHHPSSTRLPALLEAASGAQGPQVCQHFHRWVCVSRLDCSPLLFAAA